MILMHCGLALTKCNYDFLNLHKIIAKETIQMIEVYHVTSKKMEAALEKQKKINKLIQAEQKKHEEKVKKIETRQKGIVVNSVKRYFPDCLLFEQHELDEIMRVAFNTIEVKQAIDSIRQNYQKL